MFKRMSGVRHGRALKFRFHLKSRERVIRDFIQFPFKTPISLKWKFNFIFYYKPLADFQRFKVSFLKARIV
jgi:hypothetical protein